MEGCIQFSLWSDNGSYCSKCEWFDICGEGQDMVNQNKEKQSKFVIVKIYNSDIDACSHNEAGVATMSTSMGGPYAVAYPGIYTERKAALDKMDKLIDKELAQWQEYGCANGWGFRYDPGNPIGYIVVHNNQYEAGYKEYPLVAFDVIEISEDAK